MQKDGPYIFYQNNHLVKKDFIFNSATHEIVVNEEIIPVKDPSIPSPVTLEYCTISISEQFQVSPPIYNHIKKIAAFGDIHGEFDLLVKVLNYHGIIDDKLNWSFGDGHLVFCGDVFDRGDQVTECLWLIYSLEQAAEQAGGKVHYLLGNHEVMALQNDTRYLSKKYFHLIGSQKTTYAKLFGNDSVLGRWLRTKNTVVKINDQIFVHGGLSPMLVKETYSISSINAQVRHGLVDPAFSRTMVFGPEGPLWYRGYLMDWYKYSVISEKHLDEVLEFFEVLKIIFAHTPTPRIQILYDKIVAIDVELKKNRSYQFLMVERGNLKILEMDL